VIGTISWRAGTRLSLARSSIRGIRRAELAGLETEHINIELREAYVMGKGRRARIVPFGHQTARALDRYERIRKSHKNAHLPAYWLGERGGSHD
jgi:site-specific recombinase XerC